MTVTVIIDDATYNSKPGENLAALMLRNDLMPFRQNPADKTGRAPHCMMGICFECLVEVDGVPSTQACLVLVQDGMIVRRKLDD
ncbi:(2Fe-2S)-binding protein [uncultured Roseobacter sp.]|uniref:(2Fe-2S)-binding protein n=1 Tax=uncultured Roseobacter sp. TaxID=114847 RepID=UPI002613D19D|nr:(2Fe-2S)-binding protein [uncultured Roseobacter sp.]